MPASHHSSDRPERGPSRLPEVSRPRGPILDAIEQEGVSWKGQVLIVGHDGDIPALLFVTSDRLVLTNRDTILLEAPRTWLVPAPLRVQKSDVRLSITPEGVVPGRTTTERLLLTVRDGRGPASQLVAILTGRARKEQINAEFPTWNAGVGAGRSSSLPPLPAFESSQDAPPPIHRDTSDPETRGGAPIDSWATRGGEDAIAERRTPFHAPEPEPVEPQSRAARFLSNRPVASQPVVAAPDPEVDTPPNVTSIEDERRRRGAGWGIWTTRIAMVAIVALVAAFFARPYLPDEVTDRLPAIVNDNDLAINPTVTPEISSNSAAGDGTNGAGTSPEDIMPTEAALGVGGATSAIPDVEGAGEPEVAGEILPTLGPPDDSSGETADTGSTDTTDTGTGDATGGNGQEPAQTEPEVVEPPIEESNETIDEPVNPVDDTTDTIEPTAAPEDNEPPIVVETQAPPAPTDVPVTETPVPTEVPVTETPAPTMAPVTETPASTVAPMTETPIATKAPVTETPEPTTAPATETPEPTVAPATEAPAEPTLEPQPPSVTTEEEPAQQFVEEGIRYSVEGASTGTSLPELPQIAEVSYGEWIVLAVEGQNWTETEQVFDMQRFALIADGEQIQLDAGNSWVASLMDYMPAYGNTDAILWAPGEEHQFVLTFLAPPDAKSLTLKAGDQRFDLNSLLENTPPIGEMTQSAAPDTIDATVVDVVDPETIVIEKDGVQQTVRYLGLEIPDEGSCYYAEATEANRALVAGRNVKIERQATNVDAQGNWVRDVWVEQDDGTYVLVAHQLVQQGAATAGISEPNTRFASWLRGAEAVAQAEGRGLWSACEQGQAGDAPVVTLVGQVADTGRRLTA